MSQYEIAKTFAFDAAHQLDHLPETHKCSRLHGHTYRVELRFKAQALDANGFVIDYGELGTFKAWLDETCDHRNLNDALAEFYAPFHSPAVPPRYTTAEHLAEWFYLVARSLYSHEWPRVTLQCVRVSETPNTWAEYSPFSLT